MDQLLGDFEGVFIAVVFAVFAQGREGPEFRGFARLEAAPSTPSTTVHDAVWYTVWKESRTGTSEDARAQASWAHLAPVLSLLGDSYLRDALRALEDPYSEDPVWMMLSHLGKALVHAFPVFYSPQGGEYPLTDAAQKYVMQLHDGVLSYSFKDASGKAVGMPAAGSLPHGPDLARLAASSGGCGADQAGGDDQADDEQTIGMLDHNALKHDLADLAEALVSCMRQDHGDGDGGDGAGGGGAGAGGAGGGGAGDGGGGGDGGDGGAGDGVN
jgi:hypothetical protein